MTELAEGARLLSECSGNPEPRVRISPSSFIDVVTIEVRRAWLLWCETTVTKNMQVQLLPAVPDRSREGRPRARRVGLRVGWPSSHRAVQGGRQLAAEQRSSRFTVYRLRFTVGCCDRKL